MENPIRFFGVAIVISIIGGFVTKWIKTRTVETNIKGQEYLMKDQIKFLFRMENQKNH